MGILRIADEQAQELQMVCIDVGPGQAQRLSNEKWNPLSTQRCVQ